MFHRHKWQLLTAKEVIPQGIIGAFGAAPTTVILYICRNCLSFKTEAVSGPFAEEVTASAFVDGKLQLEGG